VPPVLSGASAEIWLKTNVFLVLSWCENGTILWEHEDNTFTNTHLGWFSKLLEDYAILWPPEAATGGPVVIINCSTYHPDIFIIIHNLTLFLIPIDLNFYAKILIWSMELSEARQSHALGSKQTITCVDKCNGRVVWHGCKPVVAELRARHIPEQSRIWFVSNGKSIFIAFAYCWPFPSDRKAKHYLLDFYIPSYSPNLSALIAARSKSQSLSLEPQLLLSGSNWIYLFQVQKMEYGPFKRLGNQWTAIVGTRAPQHRDWWPSMSSWVPFCNATGWLGRLDNLLIIV